MQRTASNLVRIVLIVIVSLVVIFAGLVLAVYAAFYGTIDPSAQGSHLKEAAGVLAFLLAGIFVIIVLAKGIQRVPPAPQDIAVIPATPAVTQQAVRWLIAGIAVEIGLSLVNGVFQLSKYHAQEPVSGRWKLMLISSFVLYQLPYLLLAVALAKWPNRRVFTFALIFPCVSILHSVLHILTFLSAYRDHPETFPVLLLFLVTDAAILGLAFQANRQLGYEHPPGFLAVAIVGLLVYFWMTPPMNLWFYALRDG